MGGDGAADHGTDDGAGDGSQEGDGGDEGDGGGEDDPYGFFSGSPDPPESAPGASEYENATMGFRMLVPDNWTQVGDTPIWYVEPDPGVTDARRNLNVAIELVGDTTREEYVERGKENVRDHMDAQNVRTEATVLGGEQATRLSFDGTFRGTDLTWIQVVAVHGDEAYTVTYTFPQGEDPGHETELATAVGSFGFLDGAGGGTTSQLDL